ncbi:fam-l protein [Plasmodium brasilianum]|uniref:Fam-l protein n=1 Tax=Plasmodium brasilianum TaxID=5824 RepID=A0ACB9YDB6_PLABR|nr:fam-l protein [Plasmodium brasilianum]
MIRINGMNKKKDIFNNEKGVNARSKQLRESSLINTEEDRQPVINKSCMLEIKIYSNLEKKIFKQLDYAYFLKNNKRISNKTYKQIIRKKYGLRIASTLIIFLLLSMTIIIDISLEKAINKGFFSVLKL